MRPLDARAITLSLRFFRLCFCFGNSTYASLKEEVYEFEHVHSVSPFLPCDPSTVRSVVSRPCLGQSIAIFHAGSSSWNNSHPPLTDALRLTMGVGWTQMWTIYDLRNRTKNRFPALCLREGMDFSLPVRWSAAYSGKDDVHGMCFGDANVCQAANKTTTYFKPARYASTVERMIEVVAWVERKMKGRGKVGASSRWYYRIGRG